MPYRYRTLTAWLGLLAIWFAIVGPLGSQCRAASDTASHALHCSAGHGAHHLPVPVGTHHALHLDACGYCSFFAHSPAIGGSSAALAALPSLAVASCATPIDAVASVERYSRAYARAPPENA